MCDFQHLPSGMKPGAWQQNQALEKKERDNLWSIASSP
jgi:hypothetical protein